MLEHVPQGPDFQVPWDKINQSYQWIRALKGCRQDPQHHGEGDVWIHEKLVLEALCALPEWRSLPETERAEIFWAALLHDVAKPATTREVNGKITARGHSILGAIMARDILWRMGVVFDVRERICNMTRYHQIPFWLLERDDPKRLMAEVSCLARPDHLAILAKADLLGRVCKDQQQILDNIQCFRILAEEMGCLSSPLPFADDETRYLYFRNRWDAPESPACSPFGSKVIMLSGFPGVGKDFWLEKNHPDLHVISLDRIRRENGWASTGSQGKVVAMAKEEARTLLRKGAPFAWNATNLSKRLRAGLIDLLDKYKAHVTVVYLEVDLPTLLKQNKNREHPVPESVLNRLLARWEIPDPFEACEVIHYVR